MSCSLASVPKNDPVAHAPTALTSSYSSQPLVEGRLTGIYWDCNFDLGSKIPSIYFHPSLLELENKSVFESLRIKLNI